IFNGLTDSVLVSPVIVTSIYMKDPSTIAMDDPIEYFTNLVAYDYDKLRIQLDEEYIETYKTRFDEEQAKHNNPLVKTVKILVGAAMVLGGLYLTYYTMVAFGLDWTVGTVFGWSPIDRVLSVMTGFAMNLAGRDGSRLIRGESSYFHFTSDNLMNFVLMQLTFQALGGLFNRFSGAEQLWEQSVISANREALMENIMQSDLGRRLLANGIPLDRIESLFRAMGHFDIGTATFSRTFANFANSFWKSEGLHLLKGTAMLVTFGVFGSMACEGNIAPELILQGIILAQVLLGVASKKYQLSEKIGALGLVEYLKEFSISKEKIELAVSARYGLTLQEINAGTINVALMTMKALNAALIVMKISAVWFGDWR
ncbi:MAG: hypothetical protein RTU92_03420, partial [Candidatus Thorarchaeota archaeon]